MLALVAMAEVADHHASESHTGAKVMSKGMDQKKNTKKKAQKTPDEKRAAKKAKKADRRG
jgi:hypothetical protein